MALERVANYPGLWGGVTPCRTFGGLYWQDGLGLVGGFAYGAHASNFFYGACQLDGFIQRIDVHSLIGLGFSRFTMDLQTDKLLRIHYYADPDIYLYDPETGIFDPYLYSTSNGLPAIRRNQVRLQDRWLYASGTSIYYAPLDDSLDWAWEASLTINMGSAPVISSAGGGQVWIISSGGWRALYDINSKQVVSEGTRVWTFTSSTLVWYSTELDVFISYGYVGPGNYDYELSVFANEVRPYSLSDPVALTTLQRGHVTTMEVTLLGENNDPVADFPIDWTITSGDGSLSADQTLTDDSGKAQVDYIPADLASSGFTMEAEARF